MKKCYRSLLVLFSATMLFGLAANQCLAADTVDTGSTNAVMQKRASAAERQAAAKRAKAKGFKVKSMAPVKTQSTTPPTKGGQ